MKAIIMIILLLLSTSSYAYQDNEHYYRQPPALGYPHRSDRHDNYYPPQRSHRSRHRHQAARSVFQLRNGSGLCLAGDGWNVEAYHCEDHASQLWRQVGQTLINQGLCLTVRRRGGLYNGQGLKLRECNGSRRQDWYYDADERLQYRRGFCLDLDSNTMYRDGGIIQLWDCHFNKNQRWIRQLPSSHHRH